MPRPISIKLVEDTARELMARAAIDIPADYREGVRRARDREQNRIARFVLTEMDRNSDLATAERRPVCADTGLPRCHGRAGNDTLVQFGKRGLACQPAIVGLGIGGSKDTCVRLGKEAACLRAVGSRNPDPAIAALEDELTALGNYIGIGAMGFAGTSLVVATHVEVAFSHTGGMPVGLHSFCLSSRRATARIHPDGRVEFRSDPMWFTDYYRREGVE